MKSGPGCRVYFILNDQIVGRATIANFQDLDGKEDLRDYEGKNISKPGLWVTCKELEFVTKRTPSRGFQGFRYVTEEEKPAFEAAFG